MEQAKKSKEEVIDLTEKVKLYAGAKAPHHALNEEVEVHPVQVDHFESLGFSKSKHETKAKDAK